MTYPTGLGAVLAVVVLVVVIVLGLDGKLSETQAALFAALAVARLT